MENENIVNNNETINTDTSANINNVSANNTNNANYSNNNNNVSSYSNSSSITSGWSWGGSFSTFLTLIVSKNYLMAGLYVLGIIIPIIGVLVAIGFFVYGGLKGKELIYNSDRFESTGQKEGAIKTMETIGLTILIFILCGFVGAILFGGIIAAILGSLIAGR